MNLGAGAVVMQDLTRIDEAAESGEFESNEVLRKAFSGCAAGPSDRARVRRWRPLGLGASRGADPSRRLARCFGSRAARVHRRARHAAEVGRRLSGDRAGLDGRRGRRPDRLGGRPLLGDGPRQALGSDPAGLRPARPRPGRAPRRERCARPRGRPTSATRPTSSSPRCWSATPSRCIRPGDSVFAFNFRPDRMRQITLALADPGFSEMDRGGARAGRALRDDDPVRGGLRLPGGVPARATGRHAAAGAGRARGAPAARGRDREVRPRHLLLQLRRREAVRGRAPGAWSIHRGTCPPTTTSPR